MQTEETDIVGVRALLLDLGNVVFEIDFRRVFDYWASQANVEVGRLYDRWAMDDSYKRHEVGEIDFAEYVQSLEARFSITLSLHHWLTGWNTLFLDVYPEVIRRLSTASRSLPIFALTNTNFEHQKYWRAQFPEILNHFHKIYMSSGIGLRKPDLETYEFVAGDMGFATSEILFVDDSRENITGAEAAGMKTAWVNSEADVVNVLRALSG